MPGQLRSLGRPARIAEEFLGGRGQPRTRHQLRREARALCEPRTGGNDMRGRIITLLPLLFIVGCGAEGDLLVDYDGSVDLAMEKFSGWSEPVNVGPGVNSPFQERSP